MSVFCSLRDTDTHKTLNELNYESKVTNPVYDPRGPHADLLSEVGTA